MKMLTLEMEILFISYNQVDFVKKFGYNFVIQGGVLHANYQIKCRSAQQLQRDF